MDARPAPVCFATAATASFVPGALVAIASFRRHHPAFDGDVVVIHDGIPRHLRECLQAACGDVRYERVSDALRQRLDAMRDAHPRLAHRLGEFHCLEAFRLRGYRKVLLYDADVLFRASVDELFRSPARLLCRGDEAHLRGQGRDADTFAPVPRAAGALRRTFGSGFLGIDGRLLADGRHDEALLERVSPAAWADRATQHTDQLVLNRHFAGRQTLVDWRYDYVVPMAAEIRTRAGWPMEDAKVLHFAGPAKPWMADAMLRWTEGNPACKPHPAYRWWTDAWMACLTRAHVHAAGRRWRERRHAPGAQGGHPFARGAGR